jgi:hypothetical protein
MSDTIDVRTTRNVQAGGATRPAGAVVSLPPLEAFVVVIACKAAEFVDPADRLAAIEAQRNENNRVHRLARVDRR